MGNVLALGSIIRQVIEGATGDGIMIRAPMAGPPAVWPHGLGPSRHAPRYVELATADAGHGALRHLS